jgi:hypothetical protein
MFREKRTSFIQPGIVVTFADGRVAEAAPGDFNLTDHQYRAYMLAEIVGNDGALKQGYERHLRAMARIYADAASRAVVSVQLFEDELPFDDPDKPIRHLLVRVDVA